MNLENILYEYGKVKGLGRLTLDSSGLCNLIVNNKNIVTFERSLTDDGFYIYSAIGNIPKGQEEQYYLMALKGNLFGKETGLSSIGYVEETSTLVLFEHFDTYGLEFNVFKDRFDQFLQHLFYWILKLESPLEIKESKKDPMKQNFYI